MTGPYGATVFRLFPQRFPRVGGAWFAIEFFPTTAVSMMDQELRVRVLGGAELAVSGRPLVELASAKATALLFYLAVTGAGHSRSELAGLLWSDLPEPTARANLRVVLTKLRKVLPDQVAVTRQTVTLAGDRPVWVDAIEVSRVAAGSDHAELMAAVQLCRGEFLDGFDIPGAPLFDEWVAGRRAAVRAEMIALMDRAVQWAVDQEDAATGIEVVRRMLELERLHEEAHRALMWFLAKGSQRSAALAQYETCRYLFRGVIRALANPSREVRRLLELATKWPDSLSDDLPPPASYKTARQLRQTEVDDLVAAYRAGATTRDLGVRFGVWRGTVGRHLKARGIDTRASALRPEDLQEAATLYRDGWTLDKLANRYEVGCNTIRVHLVTAGVAMRPRGRKAAR